MFFNHPTYFNKFLSWCLIVTLTIPPAPCVTIEGLEDLICLDKPTPFLTSDCQVGLYYYALGQQQQDNTLVDLGLQKIGARIINNSDVPAYDFLTGLFSFHELHTSKDAFAEDGSLKTYGEKLLALIFYAARHGYPQLLTQLGKDLSQGQFSANAKFIIAHLKKDFTSQPWLLMQSPVWQQHFAEGSFYEDLLIEKKLPAITLPEEGDATTIHHVLKEKNAGQFDAHVLSQVREALQQEYEETLQLLTERKADAVEAKGAKARHIKGEINHLTNTLTTLLKSLTEWETTGKSSVTLIEKGLTTSAGEYWEIAVGQHNLQAYRASFLEVKQRDSSEQALNQLGSLLLIPDVALKHMLFQYFTAQGEWKGTPVNLDGAYWVSRFLFDRKDSKFIELLVPLLQQYGFNASEDALQYNSKALILNESYTKAKALGLHGFGPTLLTLWGQWCGLNGYSVMNQFLLGAVNPQRLTGLLQQNEGSSFVINLGAGQGKDEELAPDEDSNNSKKKKSEATP